MARPGRRLATIDRPPPPLLELSLAARRLLQRRHLVDGDDLAAQHAAHPGDGHPRHRLRAARCRGRCSSSFNAGPGSATGAGSRSSSSSSASSALPATSCGSRAATASAWLHAEKWKLGLAAGRPRRRRRMGLWPERRLRALQGRRGLLPADDPDRLPAGRSPASSCSRWRLRSSAPCPMWNNDPPTADQLHAELGPGGGHHSADDRGLSRGGDSVGRGDRPVRRDALAEAARRLRRHLHAVVAVLAVSALGRLRVVLAAVPLRHPRSGHVERHGSTALLAPVVAVPVLHALLAAIALLMQDWAIDPVKGAWKAFVWGPPLVALAFVLSIVVLIGMMSRESSDGVREWWSRLGAWLWHLRDRVDGHRRERRLWADGRSTGPLRSHPWTVIDRRRRMDRHGRRRTLRGQLRHRRAANAKRPTAKAKEVVARVAPFVFIGGLLIAVSYCPARDHPRQHVERGLGHAGRREATSGVPDRLLDRPWRHASQPCCSRLCAWTSTSSASTPSIATGWYAAISARRGSRRATADAAELHRLRRQGRHSALPTSPTDGPRGRCTSSTAR